MTKRYGSVASQSPALIRLVNHLSSKNGLLSIKAAMTAQVFLHAEGGIPECGLLVREFDRRQAGGLPLPARVPTEAELKEADVERKRAVDEEARKKAHSEAEVVRQQSATAQAAAARHDADDVEMVELSTPRRISPGI